MFSRRLVLVGITTALLLAVTLPAAAGVKFSVKRINVGEVELDVGAAGNRNGRKIIFLHGFPEGKEVWEDVADGFKGQYAVIAPDQRGYAGSGAPEAAEAYNVNKLAADIKGLIGAVTKPGEKVLLVAHDWGGLVGWTFAHKYPELLEGFVVINCPHINAFQQLVRTDEEQQNAAAYLLKIVNAPWVMRQAMSAMDYYALSSQYDGKLREDTMATLKESWGKSLTTQINWYVANTKCKDAYFCSWDNLDFWTFANPLTVSVPTLFVWGKDDAMYTMKNLEGLDKYVSNLEIVTLADSAHFPEVDQPAKVINVIKNFIKKIGFKPTESEAEGLVV